MDLHHLSWQRREMRETSLRLENCYLCKSDFSLSTAAKKLFHSRQPNAVQKLQRAFSTIYYNLTVVFYRSAKWKDILHFYSRRKWSTHQEGEIFEWIWSIFSLNSPPSPPPKLRFKGDWCARLLQVKWISNSVGPTWAMKVKKENALRWWWSS